MPGVIDAPPTAAVIILDAVIQYDPGRSRISAFHDDVVAASAAAFDPVATPRAEQPFLTPSAYSAGKLRVGPLRQSLKRGAAAARFSFLIGPKTDLDVLLIEDPLADMLVLAQEAAERRAGANVGAEPELGYFFPVAHLLLRLALDILAVFRIYSGEIVAKFVRHSGTNLGEPLALFDMELLEFRHCRSSPYCWRQPLAPLAFPNAKQASGRQGSIGPEKIGGKQGDDLASLA